MEGDILLVTTIWWKTKMDSHINNNLILKVLPKTLNQINKINLANIMVTQT